MSSDRTLGDVGEFALIDRIKASLAADDRVLIGPGDDAAQVRSTDGTFLISTDLLVEGRHFRRDWSTAEQIGRKAAASNLSDINAMGGTAVALTVGFGAPASLPIQWVDDFVRGFLAECDAVGASLVGGDVTAAEAITIAVTVTGHATRPITRAGALPGDVVAFAGTIGMAGAGFAALSRGFRSPREAVDAHRVPAVPYAAGPQAADAGATAMIDISDGLLADVRHIAAASGVAIDIDSNALPVPEPVATVANATGVHPLKIVLTGGDDYALVATFSQATSLPDGWTQIGVVSDGSGVTVDGHGADGLAGHEHFR